VSDIPAEVFSVGLRSGGAAHWWNSSLAGCKTS